jgi:site-specific DNA recombinase
MSKAKKQVFTQSANLYECREGLVYARVSSKRQETEGSGLDSQEGRCVKELASLGVVYDRTFPDSVSGGGDFMKRPSMKALLEYIDANPHKKFVVVFDDLKRLARDVEFHIKLRTAFRIRDVILRCLNYNFDESPEGKFAEVVMAGSAELERAQNTRQVIQKQKSRLEKGYWAFGSKKGYTMARDPIHGMISEINSDGLILKEGWELFVNRSLIRKIDLCRFLVEKGFWTKQKPEKYLDKINLILQDPFYAGYIEYLPWEVTKRRGHHEALISDETLGNTRILLNRKNAEKRVRKDISEDFKMRGLIVCDTCNHHLTGTLHKKKYNYYFCQNTECPERLKTIKPVDVDKNFVELLQKHHLKSDVEKAVICIFDKVWKEEVETLKQFELAEKKTKIDLEEKISRLTEEVLNAKTPTLKSVYEKQLETLAEQVDSLDQNDSYITDISIPYRTALEKSTKLLKSPYLVWQNLRGLEQQRLFFFIFEEKLSYNRISGYRTDKIPYTKRIFEEFVTSNTQDVEMGGIEPPCTWIS